MAVTGFSPSRRAEILQAVWPVHTHPPTPTHKDLIIDVLLFVIRSPVPPVGTQMVTWVAALSQGGLPPTKPRALAFEISSSPL